MSLSFILAGLACAVLARVSAEDMLQHKGWDEEPANLNQNISMGELKNLKQVPENDESSFFNTQTSFYDITPDTAPIEYLMGDSNKQPSLKLADTMKWQPSRVEDVVLADAMTWASTPAQREHDAIESGDAVLPTDLFEQGIPGNRPFYTRSVAQEALQNASNNKKDDGDQIQVDKNIDDVIKDNLESFIASQIMRSKAQRCYECVRAGTVFGIQLMLESVLSEPNFRHLSQDAEFFGKFDAKVRRLPQICRQCLESLNSVEMA